MILEIDRYDGAGWTAARAAEAEREARDAARERELLAEADAAWLAWMEQLRRRYGHAAEHRSRDPHPALHPEPCARAWCAYIGARDRWQEFAWERQGTDAFARVLGALNDPRRRPV